MYVAWRGVVSGQVRVSLLRLNSDDGAENKLMEIASDRCPAPYVHYLPRTVCVTHQKKSDPSDSEAISSSGWVGGWVGCLYLTCEW